MTRNYSYLLKDKGRVKNRTMNPCEIHVILGRIQAVLLTLPMKYISYGTWSTTSFFHTFDTCVAVTVFDVRNDAVYRDDARKIAVSLLVRILRIGFFRHDENIVEFHARQSGRIWTVTSSCWVSSEGHWVLGWYWIWTHCLTKPRIPYLQGSDDFVKWKRIKSLACVINSSERSDFLRFYIYLCHMSDIPYLSFKQH